MSPHLQTKPRPPAILLSVALLGAILFWVAVGVVIFF